MAEMIAVAPDEAAWVTRAGPRPRCPARTQMFAQSEVIRPNNDSSTRWVVRGEMAQLVGCVRPARQHLAHVLVPARQRARARRRRVPTLAGTMSAPRPVPSALALSSEAEKAGILDEIVAADRELEDRAESAARSRLSQVDVADEASALSAVLTWLRICQNPGGRADPLACTSTVTQPPSPSRRGDDHSGER